MHERAPRWGWTAQVCDVNATLRSDPCGCNCSCGPPPFAGIVVDWTTEQEAPVTPSIASTAPSSSPSTATPTTSPTISPTSLAPTESPSVAPTTLAPSTAAPTGGGSGDSDSDSGSGGAATAVPTTAPTVTQDTLVSATMTLEQLDFAQFADDAFNASFRANYTADMAAAAKVEHSDSLALTTSPQ
jgi:hypothetical protein